MAVAAPRLDAARARPPSIPKLVRAAQPLPLTRRAPDLPGGSQRELLPSFISTGDGVSAEDVAAILNRQDDP